MPRVSHLTAQLTVMAFVHLQSAPLCPASNSSVVDPPFLSFSPAFYGWADTARKLLDSLAVFSWIALPDFSWKATGCILKKGNLSDFLAAPRKLCEDELTANQLCRYEAN